MVATSIMTINEFARFRQDGLWELLEGDPVAVTPSAYRSGWISGRIFSRIEQHVEREHLGWAFPTETGFVLFPDRATVRSPDAAFVRRERLPELTDHYVPVPPDLAVDVLSP